VYRYSSNNPVVFIDRTGTQGVSGAVDEFFNNHPFLGALRDIATDVADQFGAVKVEPLPPESLPTPSDALQHPLDTLQALPSKTDFNTFASATVPGLVALNDNGTKNPAKALDAVLPGVISVDQKIDIKHDSAPTVVRKVVDITLAVVATQVAVSGAAHVLSEGHGSPTANVRETNRPTTTGGGELKPTTPGGGKPVTTTAAPSGAPPPPSPPPPPPTTGGGTPAAPNKPFVPEHSNFVPKGALLRIEITPGENYRGITDATRTRTRAWAKTQGTMYGPPTQEPVHSGHHWGGSHVLTPAGQPTKVGAQTAASNLADAHAESQVAEARRAWNAAHPKGPHLPVRPK
jgi:hypothetical protein